MACSTSRAPGRPRSKRISSAGSRERATTSTRSPSSSSTAPSARYEFGPTSIATSVPCDCYHWYTSRGTLAEINTLSASQVVYVHVNDALAGVDIADQLDDVRLLPGSSGVIDLTGFLRALDAIGYDGPVAVEPFDAALARIAPDRRVAMTAESLHAAFAAARVRTRVPQVFSRT